ncbi:MAG: hypothetical protein IKZ53_10275 [Selenomonadaceae bacterium]|nr:hypothetical protein [Selenomonadaceae bacterium]
MTGGSIKGATVSGNDLILQVGSGSIRIINTKSANVNGKIYGEHSTVGTNGCDTLTNYDSKKTLNGSGGNDLIINGGDNVSINMGDGDCNTVENFGSNTTIKTSTGKNYVDNYESATIIGNKSYDNIHNHGSNVSMNGGDGNDFIYNEGGQNVSMSGGDGNDDIQSYGDNVTINGGDGDDSIYNHEGADSSISGGEGDDSISNYSDRVSMNGGNGNDDIENRGDSSYIDGGAGNDHIKNGDYVYYRHYDGGSNVSMNGGAGNDDIENRGDNSYINGGSGNDTIQSYGDSATIDGGAGDDTIYNDYGDEISISGGEGDDYIINGDYYESDIFDVTINGGTGNDNITNYVRNVTINSGKGDDFIYNSGENVVFQFRAVDGSDNIEGFNETSTLSISDSKYSSEKSGSDIIVTVGEGVITLIDAASLSTVNILSKDIDEYVSEEPEIITLTKNADNYSNDLEGATILALGGNDTIRNDGDKVLIDGGAGNDSIINNGNNVTIAGGEGNDVFVCSSGEVTITDYNANADKISLNPATISDVKLNDNDVILNLGNENSLTILNGVNKKITFITGKTTAQLIFEDGKIFNSGKTAVTLTTPITEFNAENYSALVTINGSAAGAVPIIGNTKANKIFAGDNGSTLNGGIGNDTLTGGNGSDVFVYEKGGGNDIIQGYGEGDKISLGSDVVIVDASMKNKDAVIKVDSSSITVKNSSEITLTAGGKDTVFSNGLFVEDNSAKAPASFKGTIDLSKYSVKNIDATLAKNAISIQGGVSDDSIIGGTGADKIYGNEGSDTICGGKGNDSLWGNNGDDTFIYKEGEGKDTIFDYQRGDLLMILDKKGNVGTFSKAAFSNNTLTLTITGSDNVVFKNVDASTEFNINGTTYQISGKTLKSN